MPRQPAVDAWFERYDNQMRQPFATGADGSSRAYTDLTPVNPLSSWLPPSLNRSPEPASSS